MRVARGIAAGDFLSHAIEHLVAEIGVAATHIQGVVDGVGIDGKFSFVFDDGIEEFNDDAIRHRGTFGIFGHNAIGVEAIFADNVVSVSGLSRLGDFDAVTVNDVIDGTLRSIPSQGDACLGGFSLQILYGVEIANRSANSAVAVKFERVSTVGA